MPQVAVWITARFYRAVFVIAALFPVLPLISGAAAVLTTLVRGTRDGLAAASLAALLLIGAGLILQDFRPSLIVYLALVQGASVGSAWLLRRTRSLTLTAQTLAVLMLVGLGFFYLAVTDVAAFWRPMLEQFASSVKEAGGLAMDVSVFIATAQLLMTGLAGGIFWIGAMLALLLGYGLYGLMPGQEPKFGRFHDLNLGRTLALVTALASVAATLTKSPWLVNTALALLVAFVLQGLALAHGIFAAKRWSPALLIIIYVLAIVPSPFSGAMIGLLSVGGYLDAWIDIRSRIARAPGKG